MIINNLYIMKLCFVADLIQRYNPERTSGTVQPVQHKLALRMTVF